MAMGRVPRPHRGATTISPQPMANLLSASIATSETEARPCFPRNLPSGGPMPASIVLLFALSAFHPLTAPASAAPAAPPAAEYARHLHALSTLTVDVAQAMPADQ